MRAFPRLHALHAPALSRTLHWLTGSIFSTYNQIPAALASPLGLNALVISGIAD